MIGHEQEKRQAGRPAQEAVEAGAEPWSPGCSSGESRRGLTLSGVLGQDLHSAIIKIVNTAKFCSVQAQYRLLSDLTRFSHYVTGELLYPFHR